MPSVPQVSPCPSGGRGGTHTDGGRGQGRGLHTPCSRPHIWWMPRPGLHGLLSSSPSRLQQSGRVWGSVRSWKMACVRVGASASPPTSPPPHPRGSGGRRGNGRRDGPLCGETLGSRRLGKAGRAESHASGAGDSGRQDWNMNVPGWAGEGALGLVFWLPCPQASRSPGFCPDSVFCLSPLHAHLEGHRQLPRGSSRSHFTDRDQMGFQTGREM